MPPIVFFGTEQHSLVALRALVEADFPVVAVVTKPDSKKGRGSKLAEPAVKTFARQHDIQVWQPGKLKDISEKIAELEAPLGVLVSYGKIIPQSIIDLFTPGIINLHPSLLPKYRGPSPIEAAMTNLDDQTGVSIMQLDAQMDAGPIYYQQKIALTGRESRAELYDTLFSLGSRKLVEILPAIASGQLQPTPQNHDQASYCRLLTKADSLLDPASLTAPQAAARVRAHLGFPRSKITYRDQTLIITAAHASEAPQTTLDQAFQGGDYLVIDQLLAPSGKKMTAQAFLNGQQNH